MDIIIDLDMIELIYNWQTLIGSFLGGVFALAAALIVASKVNRREEISSAMLVAGEITAVRVSVDALKALAVKDKIIAEEYPYWSSEKLAKLHPRLSTLFESSVTRLMPIDVILAAHLRLFCKIYAQVESLLDRLYEDYDHISKGVNPTRRREDILADSELVTNHMKLVLEHVDCAEFLISELILSRFWYLNRARRSCWKTKKEKECAQIFIRDNCLWE